MDYSFATLNVLPDCKSTLVGRPRPGNADLGVEKQLWRLFEMLKQPFVPTPKFGGSAADPIRKARAIQVALH
jgi:hypothetical protein